MAPSVATAVLTPPSVHIKGGKTLEQFQEVAAARPPGLACSFNLGAADFYPSTSGKVGARSGLEPS